MAGQLIPLPKKLEYLEEKIGNHEELTSSDLMRFHKKATRLYANDRDFFQISNGLLMVYESYYDKKAYKKDAEPSTSAKIKEGVKLGVYVSSPVLFLLMLDFFSPGPKQTSTDYLDYAILMGMSTLVSIAVFTPIRILHSYLKH